MGVRLQPRMRMWIRRLLVPVSHFPYIFFLLLSNLCLFFSARRTPSLSSAMFKWQPSSASSETRPAMSEWQLGLALASLSSLPDYPSVKLTSASFSETSCCGKSSISHPIIFWHCPKEIRSRLVSRVVSSIKPKAILACLLNA